MHLNKLSTAAMMRLSALAAVDMLLGRVVGFSLLLHPIFFLILVNLNLGLYAVMVYTGTLNTTLIAMMLAGLAVVTLVIVAGGPGASAYLHDGLFRFLAERTERSVAETLALFPGSGLRPPSRQFWRNYGLDIVYVGIDALGLAAIVGTGWAFHANRKRRANRDCQAAAPAAQPLDSSAASPL